MTGVDDQLALEGLAAFHGAEQPVKYPAQSPQFIDTAGVDAVAHVVGLGDLFDFVCHLFERANGAASNEEAET